MQEEEPRGRPKADARDIQAGARLRQRRLSIGMTQERLADAVGLTFQQIQKYERGANRISLSRVAEFARVLDVPVTYFYPDAPVAAYGLADEQDGFGDPPPPRDTDLDELLRAFTRITDPTVRQRILDLVRTLAPPDAPSGKG